VARRSASCSTKPRDQTGPSGFFTEAACGRLGERASGRSPSRWRVLLADGLEGVPEVELGDLAAEDDAGDA
jgi:hypothetical protein